MAARDYRLLAYFVEIVDAGSLREAARRLSLSPPVLSAALAALEAEVGATLLRRGRHGATPTPEGETLYRTAAAMVESARDAMAGFKARRARPAGRLRVTLPTELSLAWLPPILAAFEHEFPDIAVQVEAVDTAVDLKRSDCDAALRATHGFGDSSFPDAIAELPVELVAAPAMLRGLPQDGVRRLAALPLVALSAARVHGVYVARRRDGSEIRVPARIRIEVNNGYVAKEFAKLGFGAALVIGASVESDLRARHLVRAVPGLDFGRVVLRALLRDRHPSPAARAFIEFLRRRPA